MRMETSTELLPVRKKGETDVPSLHHHHYFARSTAWFSPRARLIRMYEYLEAISVKMLLLQKILQYGWSPSNSVGSAPGVALGVVCCTARVTVLLLYILSTWRRWISSSILCTRYFACIHGEIQSMINCNRNIECRSACEVKSVHSM